MGLQRSPVHLPPKGWILCSPSRLSFQASPFCAVAVRDSWEGLPSSKNLKEEFDRHFPLSLRGTLVNKIKLCREGLTCLLIFLYFKSNVHIFTLPPCPLRLHPPCSPTPCCQNCTILTSIYRQI